jgi:hypothetical protein
MMSELPQTKGNKGKEVSVWFRRSKESLCFLLLPSISREIPSSAQSPAHQGACFSADGETISRHACGSVTADYEVLQRLWLLLLHHGAAEHGPSRGVVGLHVSNLVSTIANYEEATYRCPK